MGCFKRSCSRAGSPMVWKPGYVFMGLHSCCSLRITSLWLPLSVSRLVGWLVGPLEGWHSYLKGREVTFSCSYRSIFKYFIHIYIAVRNCCSIGMLNSDTCDGHSSKNSKWYTLPLMVDCHLITLYLFINHIPVRMLFISSRNIFLHFSNNYDNLNTIIGYQCFIY